MIDNPGLTADLIAKLQAALPLPAIVPPRLASVLRKQSPTASVPRECQVVWITNMGDEGGITCKLATGDEKGVFFTSITHLDFDPRHPLTRHIAAYQKRRTRKLRRQGGFGRSGGIAV